MNRFLTPGTVGLGVALGFTLTVSAATAAQLRSAVTIDDDRVRLGDLFDDIADQADRTVISAPLPGRKLTFELDQLRRLAASYHIDWQPAAGDVRVVVTRASRTIGLEDLRGPVIAALTRRAVGGRLQVEFDNPNMQVVVAAGTSSVITVDNVYYNPNQRHFTADAIVGAGGRAPQRILVSGQANLMVEMPVLNRRVNPGEMISRADIGWVEFNAAQLAGDIAASEADLIDRTPRRGLGANAPVYLRDIQAPRLVTRGQLVTMVVRTPHMLITAQGKAAQDGTKGEVIRVLNVQSNRTVDATVIGSDQVAVSVPGASLN